MKAELHRVLETVARVQDLDALGSLPKLTHLSLLDNEVTKQPSYRRAHLSVHALRFAC